MIGVNPILQKKKQVTEVKWLAQDHTAWKWQSCNNDDDNNNNQCFESTYFMPNSLHGLSHLVHKNTPWEGIIIILKLQGRKLKHRGRWSLKLRASSCPQSVPPVTALQGTHQSVWPQLHFSLAHTASLKVDSPQGLLEGVQSHRDTCVG